MSDHVETTAKPETAPGAATPGGKDFTGQFDAAAAGRVYRAAGTLDLKGWDVLYALRDPATITADEVDIDATIKGSSVKTNLEAFVAGYAGTDQAADMKTFADTILKYPELEKSMGAALKDEGENFVQSISGLATGEGAIDMGQFAAAMGDPTKRDLFKQMLDRIATSELGAEYAVRFSRDAMAASKNPTDMAALNKFRQTAKDGGIDLSKIQQQALMDTFQGFLSNPEEAITSFVDSIEFLDPQMKEMMTGLLNGVMGICRDICGEYWNGANGAPGLKQIIPAIGDELSISGREDRTRYLHTDAAPATPAPAGPGN